MSRRKVTISFNPDQFADLEKLMKEDNQTNFTFYMVMLVQAEKKRRLEAPVKRSVGRPKKEEEEDKNLYPAPYKGGGAYTKDEWEGYFKFRNEEVPPLPKPLTAKEIENYGS